MNALMRMASSVGLVVWLGGGTVHAQPGQGTPAAAAASQPTTHPQYTFYTDEYQRRFTPTSATLAAMAAMGLSQADWRSWKSVFNSLARDRMTNRHPQRFMQVDQDTIPDALRYDYYRNRIASDLDGRQHWPDVLAIRDRLMRPRRGLRDHLLDADLLYQIAAYFSNNVVAPPSDFPLSSDPQKRTEQRFEYWRTHIQNFPEAERIYQYIVDHFDPDYAVTQKALVALAFNQARLQEKYDQAMENYKRFDRARTERADKTFSVDRYVVGQFLPELIAADKQLKQESINLAAADRMLPRAMAGVASHLDPARARVEFDAIERKWPDDPEASELIGTRRVHWAWSEGAPPGTAEPADPEATAVRLNTLKQKYAKSDHVLVTIESLLHLIADQQASRAGLPSPPQGRMLAGLGEVRKYWSEHHQDNPEGTVAALKVYRLKYRDIPQIQREVDFLIRVAEQEMSSRAAATTATQHQK